MLYSANLQTVAQQNEIIVTKINIAKLISSVLEIKFSEKIKTLELEGALPSVQNVPYANYINASIKGIPSNVDLEKRQSAQLILTYDKDFSTVFFAMPNGDIYLLEPYSAQKSLKVQNFAFRDWYKGAVASHQIYVSEAYFSQATNNKTIAIAEPIYSNNGTLKGLWAGLIDLNSLEKDISNLDLSHNRRIIITDHNAHAIIDTDLIQNNKNFATYSSLETVRSALDGKSGSIINVVNGTKMFSIYVPAKIGSHTWAVVLTQPYDDAFGAISTSRELSYLTITLIILVIAISGFFAYRMTRSNEILTKKLQEADIAKEEFAAMVTHELKTPLVPILGYCKMLKTSMLGKLTEEETNAIEVIEKNTKALEQLITDIMDIRKLDIGKMKFRFEDLPLDEFFGNLDSSYKKVLKDKGIEFVTKLSVKDISIHADKARLRQVFDNLIGNSIKFVSENNGLIEVGGYKENNSLILYVKDNGIGIPKDKQSNLFKKFYQIDTSLTRSVGGTGLGLAISKGIMDNLGGSIWVESDGKTGTTLYLKLPL